MAPLLSTPLLRTQSDRRLAALAADGHDRAFEAIVERYRRPLQRYLRRLLSEALAEDVLQATFVRAWQALRAGTEVRDLRPWLYRIAHNQALNTLRAAGAALPRGDRGAPGRRASRPRSSAARSCARRCTGSRRCPSASARRSSRVAVADRPHADVAARAGHERRRAAPAAAARAHDAARRGDGADALPADDVAGRRPGGHGRARRRGRRRRRRRGRGASRPAPRCWRPERWWRAAPRCASDHAAGAREGGAASPRRPSARPLRGGPRRHGPAATPTTRRATRAGRSAATPHGLRQRAGRRRALQLRPRGDELAVAASSGSSGSAPAVGSGSRRRRAGSGADGSGETGSSGSGQGVGSGHGSRERLLRQGLLGHGQLRRGGARRRATDAPRRLDAGARLHRALQVNQAQRDQDRERRAQPGEVRRARTRAARTPATTGPGRRRAAPAAVTRRRRRAHRPPVQRRRRQGHGRRRDRVRVRGAPDADRRRASPAPPARPATARCGDDDDDGDHRRRADDGNHDDGDRGRRRATRTTVSRAATPAS